MVPQLLQPPRHVLVGLMLGDVVDKQGADGAAIVGGGDGAVALLAGRVPDLGLDGLAVDLNAAGRELDADGRLAVEVEFVAGESREEVGFADAGISDQDNLEEELQEVSVSIRRRAYVLFAAVRRIRRWPWCQRGLLGSVTWVSPLHNNVHRCDGGPGVGVGVSEEEVKVVG